MTGSTTTVTRGTRARRLAAAAALVGIVGLLGALAWGPAGAQTTTTTSSSTTSTTVDPAALAAAAAAQLVLPRATIATNPPPTRAQLAGLATWLWVQPGQPVVTRASAGATTVAVTATPASVRWDTGDGQSLTCAGAGVAYDPSRPASAQHSDCTHTWPRSSAAASGGAFHVTATLTWALSWAGGPLGTRTTSASLDLVVAQAQGLDRPPVPVPGQSILGDQGATAGPGQGWDGKLATDNGGGDNVFSSLWHTVSHCFGGGGHTCLKVAGTVAAGLATAVAVGAICSTGVGCLILAGVAAGAVAGGVGGYLFCPDHDLACIAKGAGAGALGGLAFAGVGLLAGPVVAGAAAAFVATLASQLLNGRPVDPKSLAVNTGIGALLGGLLGALPGGSGADDVTPAPNGTVDVPGPGAGDPPVEPPTEPPGGPIAPPTDEVPLINGRRPINSKYAGRVYNGPEWTPELAAKYPNGVRFTDQGFPDFSPYSKQTVYSAELLSGDVNTDLKALNLPPAPEGYTWHHVEDGHTLQLVPTDLHEAIRHTGGAAVVRNLNEKEASPTHVP